MDRYFVEKQSDAIAVRDREESQLNYHGWDGDSAGIMWYQRAIHMDVKCAWCGVTSQKRNVSDYQIWAAHTICHFLNKGYSMNDLRFLDADRITLKDREP